MTQNLSITEMALPRTISVVKNYISSHISLHLAQDAVGIKIMNKYCGYKHYTLNIRWDFFSQQVNICWHFNIRQFDKNNKRQSKSFKTKWSPRKSALTDHNICKTSFQ